MTDRGSIPLPPRGPLWALGEDALSIPVGHKANTSKEVTVTEKEFDTKPNFDVEEVLSLLEVLHASKDEQNLKPLFDDAYRTLVAIAAELKDKLEQEKKEKEDEERQGHSE
jgi:hypothetical protein